MWLMRAAELGNSAAQSSVGVSIAKGEIAGKSDKDAFFWLSRAAIEGEHNALQTLLIMYLNGRASGANYEALVPLLKPFVDEEPPIVTRLKFVGDVCFREGVLQNIDFAKKCWKRGAGFGDPFSQYSLGKHFAREGLEEARAWMTKAAASSDCQIAAMAKLSLDTDFPQFNLSSNVSLVEDTRIGSRVELCNLQVKAELNGTLALVVGVDKKAQRVNVQVRRRKGGFKVREDCCKLVMSASEASADRLKKQTMYDHLEKRLRLMAKTEIKPSLCPSDEQIVDEAVEAWDEGSSLGDLAAFLRLGDHYSSELSCVERRASLRVAKDYYQKAAEGGLGVGAFKLGLVLTAEFKFTAGPIEKASYLHKAIEFLQKASEDGIVKAAYRLGKIWLEDVGDYSKAAECFEKGVKVSHAPSLIELGRMKLRGQAGGSADLHAAETHFKVAAFKAADPEESAEAQRELDALRLALVVREPSVELAHASSGHPGMRDGVKMADSGRAGEENKQDGVDEWSSDLVPSGSRPKKNKKRVKKKKSKDKYVCHRTLFALPCYFDLS